MAILNKVTPGDGDPRHGKYTTYNNHGCHCPLCREAIRLRYAELSAANVAAGLRTDGRRRADPTQLATTPDAIRHREYRARKADR